MAYVTGTNGFMVIDIKNPYKPNIITDMVNTAVSSAIVEKDGKVYLANTQQGMNIIDLSKLFYIVEPRPGAKILIKNDADGNPKMPTLAVKAVLKDGNVNLNNYPIKWNVKVEYNVNTVKAIQRSRTGLTPDWSGYAGDGYVISDISGPTYTINWGENFGGGTIVISAEVNVNGSIMTDMYIGKIEGEKTSDTFRTQMITYLKAAAANSTLINPSVQSQLGSGDVLFALACVESYGINHFWPSKFGIPSSSIYPIENSIGDGGFGVMQLTEWGDRRLPDYEQIWNWKKNIDGSAGVLKEKIAMAKRQAQNVRDDQDATLDDIPDLTLEQLRMDVYSLFRGDYYWRWGYDLDAKEEAWLPRLDKVKDKASYIDSGVFEADKAIKNEGQSVCQ